MPTMRRTVAAVFLVAEFLVAGCAAGGSAAHGTPTGTSAGTSSSTSGGTVAAATAGSSSPTALSTARRWDHVVVVVEENRDSTHIIGSTAAPYLNQLARTGVRLTDMHGETHPSEPNYLAMLSGSTQGLTSDACPRSFGADTIAGQLLSRHLSFAGYSESLPRTGWAGCVAGSYVRRHAPWVSFRSVPASVGRPLTAMPRRWSDLPTLSFVVPDLRHDMHSGTVAAGDSWLRSHLAGYATWARTHRSLLIVTWDEDEGTAANHIATVAVGQGIRPSVWTARADHYSLLASLERALQLPLLGHAATARPVPAIG